MEDQHFWLSDSQFESLKPLLPNKVRGVPRADDRKVISGIIHVIRNGCRWRDAPGVYGPHKTLDNRFVRWSRAGVFEAIFKSLAEGGGKEGSRHDRQHSSESPSDFGQSAKKRGLCRLIGRTRGGLTSRLHAVCDGDGRPLQLLLTAGQVSDHKGAAAVLADLSPASHLNSRQRL